MHFEQHDGVAQLMLFDAAALFLQLAKLLEGPFELAGEALAMEAESGEGSGLFAKGFGDG